MRIALFTIGGRGDTQPFVALAVRLRQEGHRVTLAARPDFADLAADYGVDFAPLGHPYQPFITGAAASSALGAGHLLHQLRYGLSQRRYVSDQLNQDALRAAQGAEAILYKYKLDHRLQHRGKTWHSVRRRHALSSDPNEGVSQLFDWQRHQSRPAAQPTDLESERASRLAAPALG